MKTRVIIPSGVKCGWVSLDKERFDELTKEANVKIFYIYFLFIFIINRFENCALD